MNGLWRFLLGALLVVVVTAPAAAAKNDDKPKDKNPPKAPKTIVVTGTTAASVSLAWDPSRDNKDKTDVSYELYRDGVLVVTTKATTATVDRLACQTKYKFEVDAFDSTGNRSERVGLYATTAVCPTTRVGAYVSTTGTDERWTHLAATFDGATLRLYVDGAEVRSTAAEGLMSESNGPLRLGSNTIWGEAFRGLMDDVRVYSRALSATELQADLAAPIATRAGLAGLVAAYSFDAGTGSVVADASAERNPGELAGAAWVGAGKYGGALSFDGVDDGVIVPDSKSLDLTGGMTIEAWVLASGTDQWRQILAKEGAGHLDYGLWAGTETGQPAAQVYFNDINEARAPQPLQRSTCPRENPCLTFDRAYDVAAAGTEIEVAAGEYGTQAIDGTKAAPGVVIRPATGATVVVNGEFAMYADRVELRDLRLQQSLEVYGSSHFATFRNIDTNDRLYIAGAHDLSIIGGDIGPSVDAPSWITHDEGIAPERILIEGVRFHDHTASDSSVHTECLTVVAGNGIVLRGNTFTNCAVFDVSFGYCCDSPAAPTNVVIENNFLGRAVSELGFTLHFNDNLDPIANYTIRNNSSGGPFLLDQGQPTMSNVRLVGNALEAAECGRMAWSYNVFNMTDPRDRACAGTGNLLVSSIGFRDAAAADFHLLDGSPAIDKGSPTDFPAMDFDGDVRPRGLAPDAGADEH